MKQSLPSTLAIGRRILQAREAKELTQADLAHALGVPSHQSISELEMGNRALQSGELGTLARTLGREAAYFVDPLSVEGEATYSWRRPVGSQLPPASFRSHIDKIVGLYRWLLHTDGQLENVTRESLRVSKATTLEEAERIGEGLSKKLALGAIPAKKLLEKVERDLDVPVLFVDMAKDSIGGPVSGVTVHLGELNCILINRLEPSGRRSFDLAHELFHAMSWDALPPEEVEADEPGYGKPTKKGRTEQLADKFASALLMPADLLREKVSITGSSDVSKLRELTRYFGVSSAALAFRLLGLKLIEPEMCNELRATPSQDTDSRPKRYSERFMALLADSLRSGRLSPRTAAKALQLTLDDFDALLREWGHQNAIEF
jgi:Zn-dependent peptidase ImmA (M78 family)/transcriptional regulator with XRE-family HTH domain